MRELMLRGSPYEIGLQHGRQAREAIRAYYSKSFTTNDGGDDQRCTVTPDPARDAEIAAQVEANLRIQLPHFLDEFRGIAEGAGMTYEEVLALNVWTELWNAKGCTDVGLVGEDGPLLGNTADVDAGDEAYIVAQYRSPAEGYCFVQTGFAGTVWTNLGVNETGLAYAGSALKPLVENWDGLPPLVASREVLRLCRSVDEAVACLSGLDWINHGAAMLVVDARGDMAVIEKVPTRQGVRRSVSGTLFNGNHALCEEIVPLVGDEELIANSRARCDNLTRLLVVFPSNLEGLKAILRDHTRPGAICQHGQARLHTASAAVAVSRRREVWATSGYPCQTVFDRFAL